MASHSRQHKKSDKSSLDLPKRVLDEIDAHDDEGILREFESMKMGETLTIVKQKRWSTRTTDTRCELSEGLMRVTMTKQTSCAPRLRKKRRTVDLRDVMIAIPGCYGMAHSPSKIKQDQCFTLSFENSSRNPILFRAPSNASAKTWSHGVNFIKRKLKSLPPRLQQEMVLWEEFRKADKSKDEKVTYPEASALLRKYRIKKSINEEAVFKECTPEDDLMDFDQFIDFYRRVTSRSEISDVFRKYSENTDFLTTEQLHKFLQTSQKEDDISGDHCSVIIDDYEVKDDFRSKKQFSIYGFALFLDSHHCDVFNKRHDVVYQDMKQPLSNYFIASSHNTYLTGDQLKDPSSTEAYKNALLQGCRCVELDCWDGPDGDPIIYHGYTLTSKIKFRDVMEVIRKHAFETSGYPLILSIENHCSVEQQNKMAEHMQNILDRDLLTDYVTNEKNENELPSPHALMGKILVKGKKLPSDDITGDVSDEDEAAEMGDISGVLSKLGLLQRKKSRRRRLSRKGSNKGRSATPAIAEEAPAQETAVNEVSETMRSGGQKYTLAQEKKQKLSRSFSDKVIYCQSRKFKSVDEAHEVDFTSISSFVESTANKLASEHAEKMIKYHKDHLSRTYPSGTRTDSSNYDPQTVWNAGFQVVALNYQTPCEEMTTYQGKFRQNGRCGYILKPKFMRSDEDKMDKKRLSIVIISGIQLPVQDKDGKTDLAVEVVITGDPQDEMKQRTKQKSCSGYNPVWNEVLEFDISVPDLAMVRFNVKEDGSEVIGQFVLPFGSVLQGHRFVHLFDKNGIKSRSASIFIDVTIDDVTSV